MELNWKKIKQEAETAEFDCSTSIYTIQPWPNGENGGRTVELDCLTEVILQRRWQIRVAQITDMSVIWAIIWAIVRSPFFVS